MSILHDNTQMPVAKPHSVVSASSHLLICAIGMHAGGILCINFNMMHDCMNGLHAVVIVFYNDALLIIDSLILKNYVHLL